jgi:Eco57I restriction-modification methylase
MQGQLFTQDFLTHGVKETPPWQAWDEAHRASWQEALRGVFQSHGSESTLNEAQTESEIIHKVLALLGWGEDFLPQVNSDAKGRESVPDCLLFANPQAKARALAESRDDRRYKHGIAILEAKRWLRPLDRGDEREAFDPDAPSSQMLRYLSRVDTASDRAIKWGMLTNGAVWRLYWQDARSRSEDFFEINLAAALALPGIQSELDDAPPAHQLALFYLFFCREAFLPQAWDTSSQGEGQSFHAHALSQARLYEEKVSQDLGQRVFQDIFPQLADALARGDLHAQTQEVGYGQFKRPQYTRDYLEEVREAALVLLYRLLFLFYAEDRNLLPVRDTRYSPYSVRRIREEVRDKVNASASFSGTIGNIWLQLKGAFVLIDKGDDEVGMPAYNGGLFDRARAPLLERTNVPDKVMAPIIDALSRRTEELLRGWINYRDLSVSHLGGIYERLLDYSLVHEVQAADSYKDKPEINRIIAQPASFARKVSGSYYTHDDLVRLVLRESVGLLAREKSEAFETLISRYQKKSSLNPPDWDALDAADPASAMLELKICDPAMGSGHFLVALVDDMADRILEAVNTASQRVAEQRWAAHLAEKGRPWASPLLARMADIRRSIKTTAQTHGWAVTDAQLDDRHIVRRMILKKCIFGVDKNPMAVELAKTALWLHTFTVGAPLSFLDHHLKTGDSLHGERLPQVQRDLNALGMLFQQADLVRLDISARSLGQVADLTDVDIAEAQLSKRLATEAQEQVRPLHALLDFWRALRWIAPEWPADSQKKLAKLGDNNLRMALAEIFSLDRNLVAILAAGKIAGRSTSLDAANALLAQAQAIARRETFFHWWTAFPNVWKTDGTGGFDAVIGNPPWDVAKLEEIKWFAQRDHAIAFAANTADRNALITQLKTDAKPLHKEFLEAHHAAETASRVLRDCGDFPLLSGGDINLYRVFVERSSALLRPNGLAALVVPSDITTGRTSARFFKSMVEDKRIGTIFDFENRKPYFPDVDRRQKFCVFLFGSSQRQWPKIHCGFYLADSGDLQSPEGAFYMTGQELTAPNANSGGAAMFRTAKDALLAGKIYANHPILVARSSDSVKELWPVKYTRVMDMSTDAKLFKRKAALLDEKWTEGHLRTWTHEKLGFAIPLYEGKMVQSYDHRAAEIIINPANLHRPAQEVPVDVARKANPSFLPDPQYWVRTSDFKFDELPSAVLGFKDVTSPTNIRSAIAAFIPASGAGHTFPLLLPKGSVDHKEYLRCASLLLANLNAFVCDFFLRQKLQTQHLTLFMLEQLPVIAPGRFDQPLPTAFAQAMRAAKLMNGHHPQPTVADFVIPQVLALSYTAHDLAPFAKDLGYVDAQGQALPPFVWNDEERRARMAALDALFFYLYGIQAEDAAYILSTFPIVREQDEKAFGRFRTQEDILALLPLLD